MPYDVKFHREFVPEWKALEMGLKNWLARFWTTLKMMARFLVVLRWIRFPGPVMPI